MYTAGSREELAGSEASIKVEALADDEVVLVRSFSHETPPQGYLFLHELTWRGRTLERQVWVLMSLS